MDIDNYLNIIKGRLESNFDLIWDYTIELLQVVSGMVD